MSQKRSYRQYSAEFKEEAVSLVTEQGYSVAEAAKSLGISTTMLYNWKTKLEEKQTDKQLNETEREELMRLRKENRNLRMEKEILKKASVNSNDQRNSYIKKLFCRGFFDEAAEKNVYV